MTKLKLTIALCIGGIISACSGRSWELIPEDDMRQLLPRYSMLTASLQSRGEADSLRRAAYKAFFAEEGYTLTDWDSSMMWYAKHNIPFYYDLYRKAGDSLVRLTDRLQKRLDSITIVEERSRKLLGYTLDSVNLLKRGSETYKVGELVSNTFSIAPSTPYTGVQVELSVVVKGLQKQKAPSELSLELFMYAQDSTVQSKVVNINKSGRYSITLQTLLGKPVIRLTGGVRGVVPRLSGDEYLWLDSLRFVRVPYAEMPVSVPAESQTVAPLEPIADEIIDL